MTPDPALAFAHVDKTFVASVQRRGGRGAVPAVRDFTLEVAAGEIVGLVGESGAGKTTVGRLAMGLETPSSGTVSFEGTSLAAHSPRQLRLLRRQMHMIFQDPYQSLHPGLCVGVAVSEPLQIAGVGREQRRAAALAALGEVSLTPANDFIDRYPHELSGGQRQRVAFARALVAKPRCVIADEPTSMLDVSLRAGILALVDQIRRQFNSAVLYITHDLAVAKHVCDRIAVMRAGELVELGSADQIIDQPEHAYTRQLLAAAQHLGHG